jgi:hypothetical protein
MQDMDRPDTLFVDEAAIEIASGSEVVGEMRAHWPVAVLKREPMLFACDVSTASELAGPVTRAWLDALPQLDAPAIIDTRVHMLIPGFWPCIPGWHHDDVPREREDGQPDYFKPSYRTTHIATFVCAGSGYPAAPTEYASGTCGFPDVPVGEKFYKRWSPMVDEAIANGWLPFPLRGPWRAGRVQRSDVAPRHAGRRFRVALVRATNDR